MRLEKPSSGVRGTAHMRDQAHVFETQHTSERLSSRVIVTNYVVRGSAHVRGIPAHVSDLQSLMVLSFSRLAEAMMFSVGWQAVHRTTSVCPTHKVVEKTSIYCRLIHNFAS